MGTLFRAETTETSARGDDDANLCVLTVNHDVPADRAREYAKTLLDSVNAEHVVALTAVDENVLEEPSFDDCGPGPVPGSAARGERRDDDVSDVRSIRRRLLRAFACGRPA